MRSDNKAQNMSIEIITLAVMPPHRPTGRMVNVLEGVIRRGNLDGLWDHVFYLFQGDGLFLLFYFDAMLNFSYIYVIWF